MIAMLIIETDRLGELVAAYLKPLGFEIIRYTNPLKALDNLDEVVPDVTVCSAEDFPRHWKPIIQVLREKRTKDDAVFILLKGPSFNFDEAAKAMHLGVNGVIREDLNDPKERERLQKLLARYIGFDDQRANARLVPGTGDRIAFMFSHPTNSRLVTGRIEDISPKGLNFMPDNDATTADLEPGIILRDCSLRVGEPIFSVDCTVIRNGRLIALRFEAMSDADRGTLETYLKDVPERELKAALKRAVRSD
jgi:hypothetical protein